MRLQLRIDAVRVQEFGYSFWRCRLVVKDKWIPKRYTYRAPEENSILGGLAYWKHESIRIRQIIKDSRIRGD